MGGLWQEIYYYLTYKNMKTELANYLNAEATKLKLKQRKERLRKLWSEIREEVELSTYEKIMEAVDLELENK
jgi:predicted nuclease with TOPRIM domain